MNDKKQKITKKSLQMTMKFYIRNHKTHKWITPDFFQNIMTGK